MEVLLVALIVLIIGLAIFSGVLLLKVKSNKGVSARDLEGSGQISELKKEIASKDEALNLQNSKIISLTSERDVYKSQLSNAEKECEKLLNEKSIALREQEKIFEERFNDLRSLHKQQVDEIKANNERMLEQMRESSQKQMLQIKESNEELNGINAKRFEDQLKLIKEQMKATSEEVLKQRQSELGEQNMEQVSKIINPLMESFKGMKEAFEITKEKQKEEFTRLDETIRLNTQKSTSLGETADRLARALTGEVKAQGNFGELKLKQLLENMELKEGEQYDTQETLRDAFGKRITGEDGKGLIPDFILHFPNNRHVVIDAKMSLTAYERYMNSDEDSDLRRESLAEHIQSIRNNVNRLSKKSYYRYLPEGYNRLDFAFMYVPIDAALNLALLNDSTLWKDAYDMGVIILGPQTMYMNLRVLEMMWTQIRQLENQQAMITYANQIIERVQDFATRFKDVDTSMHNVIDKLNRFKISAGSTGRSIITAAQNLVKAGGQENKSKVALSKNETVFIESDESKLLS